MEICLGVGLSGRAKTCLGSSPISCLGDHRKTSCLFLTNAPHSRLSQLSAPP